MIQKVGPPGTRSKQRDQALRVLGRWRMLTRGVRLYAWQWHALWQEADRTGVGASAIIRECISSRFPQPIEEDGQL